MNVPELIEQAQSDGVTFRVAGDKVRINAPDGRLVRWLPILRPHRTEIRAWLTAGDLIAAAMRACDHHGDSEAARQEMVKDCLDTPPELRQELQEHFQRACPSADGAARVDQTSSVDHEMGGPTPDTAGDLQND